VKTDGQKCIKEPKVHFCSFPSRNAPNSGRVNVAYIVGVWCYMGEIDCYVECVTVQNNKCTDSVQCETELY